MNSNWQKPSSTNYGGPYGYNDNNLARTNVPSNFSGNNNYSNNYPNNKFQDVYRENRPLIQKINYTNPNTFLHNNIGDQLLNEHIQEYRINIDSIDRDLETYPNPFKFNVNFIPAPSETIKGVEYKGTPKPYISKNFKRVKYVRIENIILPQYSGVIDNEGVFEPDPNRFLPDDRFISLVIPELDCDRNFSTSNSNIDIKRPFASIVRDQVFGNKYYYGLPYYSSKIYKSSRLGNINNLSINLHDSFGELIEFNTPLTVQEIIDGDIPTTDLRHPLNKSFQSYMTFVFGIVEAELDTDTKFTLS
jgi:hypothetical protein